jgi:hypothetical protein
LTCGKRCSVILVIDLPVGSSAQFGGRWLKLIKIRLRGDIDQFSRSTSGRPQKKRTLTVYDHRAVEAQDDFPAGTL